MAGPAPQDPSSDQSLIVSCVTLAFGLMVPAVLIVTAPGLTMKFASVVCGVVSLCDDPDLDRHAIGFAGWCLLLSVGCLAYGAVSEALLARLQPTTGLGSPPQRPRVDGWEIPVIICVTAGATALRLPGLTRDLSYDELFSAYHFM